MGLDVMIDAERLANRVRELAVEIGLRVARESLDDLLTFVVVMDGAFIFAADLVRWFGSEASVSFVRAKSYDGENSGGRIFISRYPNQTELEGKHVVLVDDILDTGRTWTRMIAEVQRCKPATLWTCALLDKPSRREVPVVLDFRGFEIPDKFVVGYGMDYNGRYRALPYIGVVNDRD